MIQNFYFKKDNEQVTKKKKKIKRYLQDNLFKGSIPTELGNLTNLEFL